MANLDITNKYEVAVATVNQLTSSSTFFTAEIDVSNADPGFALAFIILDTLNGMTITIKLQENNGAGFVDIPDNKIISTTGNNSIVIDADQNPPLNLDSIGAFSNSILVRAEITVIGYTTDVALASILYRKTEQLPPPGT